MNAAENRVSSFELAQLHHDLGRFYAHAAPQWKCDYIGFHGQTVFHNPNKKNPATFQIGEPSYLAIKLNAPVICQFRNMDLALGGQGAPLATLFHKTVFGDEHCHTAVNNIGGISNVTFLPAKNSKLEILAFDTGPGNMLIDKAVLKYTSGKVDFDRDGELASQGISNLFLVEKWIKETKYFSLLPPKSTGRELFNDAYFNKIWKESKKRKLSSLNTIATITLFTAESIVSAYKTVFKKNEPEKIIICGGGSENKTLMKMLRFSWARAGGKGEVYTSQDFGWPAQSVEPAAFAQLAFSAVQNTPGNIPSATGAKKHSRLGQFIFGP
jgi:anhydro-N-acetylmuramic acid kinase